MPDTEAWACASDGRINKNTRAAAARTNRNISALRAVV
jgi:hypothetical protein